MVCQLCVDEETCPDCEKPHPHDIHTTPPPQYSCTFKIDLRTPEMRIEQLEKDVHKLRGMVEQIAQKFKRWGYDHE